MLRHELDRNLVVLAPTGVAALNVGGQTIHSFFQLPPGPQPIGKKLQGVSRDVIAKMDNLIIDEVSIDYEPRTYAEGKKIGLMDGLLALWTIVRDRLKSTF